MRTVSRAAAAGRPKARSAIGLKGGRSAGGERVWWGSAPRTAEGAKRRRSQGGYVGVAPPRRKGGSERYRHWLLPSLGDGEGGQLQWRSQKFVKGAGVRVQTVGRAAAAGRPMAQSAVGLSGMGGLQGVAPVKGGSGLYRHGQL